MVKIMTYTSNGFKEISWREKFEELQEVESGLIDVWWINEYHHKDGYILWRAGDELIIEIRFVEFDDEHNCTFDKAKYVSAKDGRDFICEFHKNNESIKL